MRIGRIGVFRLLSFLHNCLPLQFFFLASYAFLNTRLVGIVIDFLMVLLSVIPVGWHEVGSEGQFERAMSQVVGVWLGLRLAY